MIERLRSGTSGSMNGLKRVHGSISMLMILMLGSACPTDGDECGGDASCTGLSGETTDSSASSTGIDTTSSSTTGETTSGTGETTSGTGETTSGTGETTSGTGETEGETGGETTSGTSSDSSGGESTGGVDEGASDADAVDWPEPCLAIAAEDIVCLSVTEPFDGPLQVVAFSLQTGAQCTVTELSSGELDLARTWVWSDDQLAWPGGFEDQGMVVDLDDGSTQPLDVSEARLFEWDDGILEDPAESQNFTYYETLEALVAGTVSETLALDVSGRFGVVREDVLYTFDNDGTDGGASDLLTKSSAAGISLAGFTGFLDGLSAAGDRIIALSDETAYVYDFDGQLVETQPLSATNMRGLACSRGLTP